MASKRKKPAIVYEDGKPSAVILDIDEYEELLERAEDAEDLRILLDIRRRRPMFRTLDEFLAER